MLAGFLRLPDTARLDLTPWHPWRAPVLGAELGLDGPLLVTVEYDVRPGRAADFLAAMREFGRIRRRDRASHWGICRDLETSGRYLETFIVGSWDEHLRQHERMTRADSSIEESLRGYVRGEPIARHLLYV